MYGNVPPVIQVIFLVQNNKTARMINDIFRRKNSKLWFRISFLANEYCASVVGKLN